MICTKCGKDVERFRDGKSGKNPRWRDDRGRLWGSRACPDCKREMVKQYERKIGKRKAIEDLTNCTIATGRVAENLVADFFRELGMTVKQTNGIGPDIVANGLTVEVKHMSLSEGGFRCGKIYPRRRNDDLVALVARERIVIETMEEHLNECSPGGQRYVKNAYFRL